MLQRVEEKVKLLSLDESHSETEYMVFNQQYGTLKSNYGNTLKSTNNFKYLQSDKESTKKNMQT